MPKTNNVSSLHKAKEKRPRQPREIPANAVSVRFPEFIAILGVGETKGKELIRTGAVESVKLGSTRLISLRSIRELIHGQAA